LTYYVDGVQQCHVYYANKTGFYDGEIIAQLDLDDVSSYVPKDKIGTVWHVFDITDEGIKSVNEFYTSYGSTGVR